MKRKILWFDVETTGMDAETCSIWQIAGIIEVDGEIKQGFKFHIAPYKPEINPKALEIGGVTEEQIRDYRSAAEVFQDLSRMLKKHVNPYDRNDKMAIAGYNVGFDEEFLRAFWKHHNDQFYGSIFWSGRIDVLSQALDALLKERHRLPNFKLGTVAEHLNIPLDNAHDALADVTATREIYHLLKTTTK